MQADLNSITLTGTLERDPQVRFADHGTQQVSFTLKLLAPQVVIRGIELLHQERQLTRRGASQIQERILILLDATGAWK